MRSCIAQKLGCCEMAEPDDVIVYQGRINHGQEYGSQYLKQTKKNTLAVSLDTRATEVLKNPNNYYVKVKTITIPTTAMPLSVFDVNNASGNVTICEEIITMQFNGFNVSEPIKWRPENETIPAPQVTQNQSLYDTEYFYLWTFQHLCYLVNDAFVNAFAGLKILLQSQEPPQDLPFGSLPPFISYNRDHHCFDLYAQFDFYNNKQPAEITASFAPTIIYVWYNSNMYNLFYNVYARKINEDNDPNNKVWLLTFKNLGDNIIDNDTDEKIYSPYSLVGLPPLLITGYIIKMSMEYSINCNICESGASLVLTSDVLSIEPTLTAPTSLYSTQTIPPNLGVSNILIELPMVNNIKNDKSLRTHIEYINDGHDLFNLNSTLPLKNIDFKIFFRDTRGVLRELYLNNYNSCTIQLYFIRKDSPMLG